MNSNSPHKQRGVVIVIALFIVALVAALAYTMMARVERDTRRLSMILHAMQANNYAQGSILWAVDQLRNDWERQRPNSRVDVLPIVSRERVEAGYKIKSTIYDMQARFNINNLQEKNAQADFSRLLLVVVPTLRESEALAVAKATSEWVSLKSQENESDRYYFELPSPYRAAHRAMVSPSELRLVKGVTPEIYQALQPYVTALPQATRINVQTADTPVLMSLNSNLSKEAAKVVIQARARNPLISTKAFSNLDVIKSRNIEENKVTVVSNYFLVETTVTIEKQQVVLYTLIERLTRERRSKITVLWTGMGVW